MRIDFSKLVVLLLPTMLRRTKLAYFIEACIQPIVYKYNEMLAWGEEKRLEQATNWQVCQLEAYLNKILLGDATRRDVYITDADGIICDFYVNISSRIRIDENRAKAIVDKFKLLGRRYQIAGSVLTYSCEWIDKVDEYVYNSTLQTWINHVDEYVIQKMDVTIEIEVISGRSQGSWNSSDYIEINLNAKLDNGQDWPVASDIEIVLRTVYNNGNEAVDRTLYMRRGTTGDTYEFDDVKELYVSSSIISITPTSDDYCNYNAQIV